MNKRIPAEFPITIIIVEHGYEEKKVINENKLAHCRFCNHGFLINSDTAYVLEGCIDQTPFVRCPQCNRRISAVYFTDVEYTPTALNKPKRKRKQYIETFLYKKDEGVDNAEN